jgi:Domain of unknown function (DUF1906)
MKVMRGVAAQAALSLAVMACLLTSAVPAPAAPAAPRQMRADERLLPAEGRTAGRADTRAGTRPASRTDSRTDSRPTPTGPLKRLPVTGDLRRHGARIYHGRAFDTCTAPSLTVLRAWRRASGYRAVGIYFGGRARACAQPRLTRAWVRAGDRMGWRFLPLYMGSQPRCSTSAAKRRHPISARHPATAGRREGADAVRRARALGLRRRSPLYLDIESYRIRNRSCARGVLAFARAWNRAVRHRGYFAGFYSSANSGVLHMAHAQRAKRRDLADVMWVGRWNNSPRLTDPVLPRAPWTPHRRVHQYRGNVRESHGGRTLLIDRNAVDAPVAIVSRRKRR